MDAIVQDARWSVSAASHGQESMMKPAFAEVLACETTALAAVADADALRGWRQELVDRATNPESAYAKVLHPAGDPRERAAFLDRWRDLIAVALARVVATDTAGHAQVNTRQMAVSILAALYGGTILSRVAKDHDPLRISVDLVLAPLLLPAAGVRNDSEKTGPSVP
jgi:transcriptional regulator LmrA/YxaF-like protein